MTESPLSGDSNFGPLIRCVDTSQNLVDEQLIVCLISPKVSPWVMFSIHEDNRWFAQNVFASWKDN